MRDDTQRLARLLAPAVRALYPPETMQRMRRTDLAITAEGKASDYALAGSLGHLVASWFLSGTLTTGTNKSTEHRVAADGVLERIDVRVKTAPAGDDLIIALRLNGVVISTVTIRDGRFTAGLIVNQAASAGDILTIDITQVGSGTAGSSLSAAVTYREERGA